MFAARAGIDLLLEVGVDRIAEQVESLVTRCLDGLAKLGADVVTPLDPAQRAGVIVVNDDQALHVFDTCRSRRIDVGTIGTTAVRVDPHGFNDAADVDRFLACFGDLRS